MQVEIYDLDYCYRVVEKSFHKKDIVYDLTDWSDVSDKIKYLSSYARVNSQKQPTFVFYF
ncbi:hypothetical protein [uncultured Eubacterium sp.]|uniref:hypothetical protein n=1 Tax=uncultured Eubacterium sp. TaxID=165185 RepID=UPI0015AA13E4|nr:hypothetical protein [uncultured Eubacterium sp.]